IRADAHRCRVGVPRVRMITSCGMNPLAARGWCAPRYLVYRRCCSSCFLRSAWSRIAAIPPVAPGAPEDAGVAGLAPAALRHTQPTLLAITTTESSARPIDSHMDEHWVAESRGTSTALPTPTLAGVVQAARSRSATI